MIDSVKKLRLCVRGCTPPAGGRLGGPRSYLGLVAVGIVVLLAAGCAQIPRQELSQYRAAFGEVEAASVDILIDYAEVLEESREFAAAPATGGVGAHVFSDELNRFGDSQSEDVEVRRLALRTIGKFNNVLVTLAEGKSIESVQTTAEGFMQALGKFIGSVGGGMGPGFGAVMGPLKTLAAEMEKARLREEFEAAVRSGAPIVNEILSALIADREDHLLLRQAQANLRQLEIVDEISTSAGNVIALFAARDVPGGLDEEHGPRATLQTELNEVLEPAKLYEPVELAYQAGNPSFSEQDRILAAQVIEQIKPSVAAYRANIAQYESFRAALNNYGTMLYKTQIALETLVEALDRPMKFEAVSDELFAIAFTVKRDVAAFKAARSVTQ